jgi:hypothetical protein
LKVIDLKLQTLCSLRLYMEICVTFVRIEGEDVLWVTVCHKKDELDMNWFSLHLRAVCRGEVHFVIHSAHPL